MTPEPVTINMSGIPVAGVGGLGLVAVAVLMTVVIPQAWWLMLFGAVGALLGVAMVMVRRNRRSSGPSGGDPHVLFRSDASDRPVGEGPRIPAGPAVKELAVT